jgi:hypothetical protein
MLKLEYRVLDLEAGYQTTGWTVYDTEQEAYQAMSATAKEYKEKGYEVRTDNQTVRVWEDTYTWPIVYKMFEIHIEIEG